MSTDNKGRLKLAAREPTVNNMYYELETATKQA